jgi:mRNA-degrading endonuclease RelE of RelBE toxin-antitoxin system
MTGYEIRLRNNAALKNWRLLSEELPEQMERLKQFLQENPENRLLSKGKLKKLKGKLKGILQYDLTDSYRVHYRVATAGHIVYVEYIGPHP